MRTRGALLRAAAEVFDDVGYSGASVAKILERAGLTAGAMYFHFASKEELARAVINEQAADLKMPQGDGGLQQLLDMTHYLAIEMQTNTLFRAGVRLAVEQGEAGLQDYAIYEWWAEQFRQELVRSREMGQLRPEVDETDFARVLVGAYTGTQIMSQIATRRADLPERIATMWRCLLPAIAPAEVIAGLEIPTEQIPVERTSVKQSTVEQTPVKQSPVKQSAVKESPAKRHASAEAAK
ncbi:ScbR family autoregulator-binding transcription factor [Streptomyces sp. XD-27]|uniref:ScbR family autoregulator-binding transcription factor n=1 Tax=Streptomyces sp. XD-27 TaxID=3062779 RepID=UPI0026F4744F|nr:ScbR family autoregulator-binding transcription factor [Streptomyces sp. XD-27]WKX71345.1 ScbR family autoregulator-binding transcription factor [Streptomyces sp. XD-27]